MDETDGSWALPTHAELEQLAANEPKMLNPLVAYFVFEWQKVVFEKHPWGKDQIGVESIVPDYVTLHGTDCCVNWLFAGPVQRGPLEAGTLTFAIVELMSHD